MSVRRDDRGTTGSAPRRSERLLWVVVALLTAALVGLVAGWLTWLGGANVANSVLAGGAAFAGASFLMLSCIQFVHG